MTESGEYYKQMRAAADHEIALLGAEYLGRVAGIFGRPRESLGESQWEETQRRRTGNGSAWSGVWIPCADGKARRIEPGLEPLAHGISGRVGRLRAYGNAIVPEVAEAFIRAYAGA
jgi:hypothetical protein